MTGSLQEGDWHVECTVRTLVFTSNSSWECSSSDGVPLWLGPCFANVFVRRPTPIYPNRAPMTHHAPKSPLEYSSFPDVPFMAQHSTVTSSQDSDDV